MYSTLNPIKKSLTTTDWLRIEKEIEKRKVVRGTPGIFFLTINVTSTIDTLK